MHLPIEFPNEGCVSSYDASGDSYDDFEPCLGENRIPAYLFKRLVQGGVGFVGRGSHDIVGLRDTIAELLAT